LALAKFPDGETPDVTELAREAGFMFVAGGETTTRLLGFLLRHLTDHPEFQEKLRRERQLISNFVEEMLRMENPVRAHFRLARRTTKLGGVEIPAGTTVMLLIAAVNRDPRRFDAPQEFRLDRPNPQDHISFARGAHACLGMSLARAESRVSLERVLDRMNDIKVSETEHGPIGAQQYEYDPTFVFRGMKALHLTFTPA
jgi:cytochrome P450